MINEIKFEQLCRQVNEQHAFLEQLQKDIKDLTVQLKIFVGRQSSAVCKHLQLKKKALNSSIVNSTANPDSTCKLSWHECVACGDEVQVTTIIKKVIR